MFNERDALKLRLEQLLMAEEKTIREFREERREILDRLRELDLLDRQKDITENKDADQVKPLQFDDVSPATSNERLEEAQSRLEEKDQIGREPVKEEKPAKGYHKKTLLLRDATLKILQQHHTAIPLAQLKKELEQETGVEIKNISLFMTNLAKKESHLKKATHGQYMYINN
ncbi:Rok-like winged helix domain-containing protein [Peribacillus deserti]|uniref:Competence protein ComK n=1 Tax=Peribacillus deserti TaxID=673318 RepID=A0A2N5M2F7_9BACI|nr:hypothetical protein [Peribacillus deserti]PLT28547.1 hypothetical protein CUU66_17845 [Peribacillus deserti]